MDSDAKAAIGMVVAMLVGLGLVIIAKLGGMP